MSGMRLDPFDMRPPTSDQRRSRLSASYLRGFRLLPKGIFPTARLHRTTSQSIANDTGTELAFDAVSWDRVSDDRGGDPDGFMAETANDRLKIRVPGIYSITGTLTWASNATGRRLIAILLNGTVRFFDSRPADPTFTTGQTITELYELALDDLVTLEVRQTSGGALSVLADAPYRPALGAVWVAL